MKKTKKSKLSVSPDYAQGLNQQKENKSRRCQIITVDTDWASDEIIEYTSQILLKFNLKAAWFITHKSPAIVKLFKHADLFEFGIHPNFLPESSQGKTIEEVMDYLLEICPNAKAMRSHALHQSTPIFKFIAEKYPQIKMDVSLFIPYGQNLKPHQLYFSANCHQHYITRIPYLWEDSFELFSAKPNFAFNVDNFPGNGIKIFNFHPIHILLNSNNWGSYMSLKEHFSTPDLMISEALKFRNDDSIGTEDFLRSMIENKNIEFVNLKEMVVI